MAGKHSVRPTDLSAAAVGAWLRSLPGALPATATDLAGRTRRDPMRGGLAAGALLVTMFLLVTSVWAVFGREPGTNRTIMVRPSGPVRVVPAGGTAVVESATVSEPAPAPSRSRPSATTTRSAPATAGAPSPSRGSSVTSAPGVPPSSRTSRPTVRPSSAQPSATRTTTAPAPSVVTALYAVGASWETGFIGAVQVTNTGTTEQTWQVTVRHSRRDGVRITNAWNADLARDGSTAVLSGGPLAPGASVNVGFEATKRTDRRVQPTSCTVNGEPCRIG